MNKICKTPNLMLNPLKVVQKACTELADKMDKSVNPNISFDLSEINGKVIMSVQNLIDENGKGVFLKFSQGQDSASTVLAKGDGNNLKKFIRGSAYLVNKKILELSDFLQKAGLDEAKSLTDF